MTRPSVGTLVIGGGQAGLAMSCMLTRRGLPHLIVERHRIAERWHSERWDGLHFQSPEWSIALPGFPFPGNDPDRFPTGREILDYITAYAEAIKAPARTGVAVTALRQDGIGFVAETSADAIQADNVVIATGPYQRPLIPTLLPQETGIVQLHASAYRNPAQLPDGAVLVVGSGNSGAQIAEELLRAGRTVYLSVGRHRRVPRPYRGKDLIWWWRAMGMDRMRADQRGADRSAALTSGALGGYTIDLRAFAARGMVLAGRTAGFRDGAVQFAPDLAANVAHGDAAYAAFMVQADAHVLRNGLDLPDDPAARAVLPDPPSLTAPLSALPIKDLAAVVWATGYQYELGWLHLPVLDAAGAPVHRDGVTDVPGLYFLGLHFLSNMVSALLSGVGEDAERLADHILARR